MTIPSRSSGSAARTSGESSAPGLTLRARNVRSGRPCARSAARSARGLQRGAQPGAVRLVEPVVGRAERALGHPRQRLVAGHAAGRELQHGLEDRHDRALVGEQRLDLGALAVARELAGEPAVVAAALVAAGALRPVQRAVGELEQPHGLVPVVGEGGHAGRARERAPADEHLGDRRPRALGGLGRLRPVDARQDQRELLAAEPGDEVVLAHARSAAAPRRRRAPCRPRRGRRRR